MDLKEYICICLPMSLHMYIYICIHIQIYLYAHIRMYSKHLSAASDLHQEAIQEASLFTVPKSGFLSEQKLLLMVNIAHEILYVLYYHNS